MSREIHTRFLEIAKDLSPMLADAIANNGPIEFAPWQDVPFSERLCRSISGQELSVQAANAIWGCVVDSVTDRLLIEHFAEADLEALRACGLSAAKAKAMRAVASAALAGQLDAEAASRRRSSLIIKEREQYHGLLSQRRGYCQFALTGESPLDAHSRTQRPLFRDWLLDS